MDNRFEIFWPRNTSYRDRFRWLERRGIDILSVYFQSDHRWIIREEYPALSCSTPKG